jgi:hypothetical protein
MDDPYSENYRQARDRFREAARTAGARLEAHPVEAGAHENESLTIDVAILGPALPGWSVVVSSGLHGVEGFFGSAIQIASLQQLRSADLDKSGGELIFIHAINPFGFSELRRVNEDNIDLNRNFLAPGEAYAGASGEYAALNDFLNPGTPPKLLDPYLARVGWTVARLGMPALKQAVAEGQYLYPKGLFFGGDKSARSTEIIKGNLLRWIGGRSIVHVDFHSGLGKYARYTLLAPVSLSSGELDIYRRIFGAAIEVAGADRGIAYRMKGNLGQYISAVSGNPNYRFLFVEFGTHSAVRILGALRKENQAHFFTPQGSPARRRAKAELLECFCPASSGWRKPVLARGLEIIQAAQRLAGS